MPRERTKTWVMGAVLASMLAIGGAAGASEEKPFFTIDAQASGPLTLDELDVNIPEEMASQMSEGQQACFIAKIGDLAADAGDPETLDPADVAYLPTDGSWAGLTTHARRAILAQAVISRAITFC